MGLGINGRVTILDKNQLYNAINVIRKKGITCETTDLARLLGVEYGKLFDSSKPTAYWCVFSDVNRVEAINKHSVALGMLGTLSSGYGQYGLRPVIPFDDMSDIPIGGLKSRKAVSEIEMGEYPQECVSYEKGQRIEEEYKKDNLKKTGKSYRIMIGGEISLYKEYEYNSKKYIRVKSRIKDKLPSGKHVGVGEYVWVEVTPIKWYVDREAKILLSKYPLMPAMHPGNIKEFLNNYFVKDIDPNYSMKNDEDKVDTIRNLVIEINNVLNHFPNGFRGKKVVDAVLSEHDEKIVENHEMNEFDVNKKTPDMICDETIAKLEDLLNKFIEQKDEFDRYTDILNTLQNCIDVLKGKKNYGDNTKLYKTYKGIGLVVLPYLKDPERDELYGDFYRAVSKYEKEVRGHLVDYPYDPHKGIKSLRYNNIDELDLIVTAEIFETLLKMKRYVSERDITGEINRSIIETMSNNFLEGEISTSKGYLEMINDLVSNILSKIETNKGKYSSYKKEVDKLLSFGDVSNLSEKEKNDLYYNVIMELCSLEFKLDRQIDDDMEASKYFVDKKVLL